MLYEDIIRRQNGTPVWRENMTLSTSNSYSNTVFPANSLVRAAISTADVAYVSVVREYLKDNEFGEGLNDEGGPRDLFTVAATGIADDDEFGGGDNWELTTVTSTHVMEVTNAVAGNYSLEFLQVDASDILTQKIGLGADERLQSNYQKGLPYNKNMIFRIRHNDDDAGETLSWEITFYLEGTGLMYWNDVGSAWTATPTANVVTGSATDAVYLGTWTTYASGDERVVRNYNLNIHSTADYAAGFSYIDNVGIHEAQGNIEGAMLGYAGATAFFSAPYPFRIAADAAANTPTLNLCQMMSQRR